MRDGKNDLPLCLARLQVHLNVFRTEEAYFVTSLSTVLWLCDVMYTRIMIYLLDETCMFKNEQ